MGGYFYDYDGTKTRPNQETKGSREENLAFFTHKKQYRFVCGGGITIVIAHWF